MSNNRKIEVLIIVEKKNFGLKFNPTETKTRYLRDSVQGGNVERS